MMYILPNIFKILSPQIKAPKNIPALFYFYVSSIYYIIVYLSYVSTQILNFVIRSLSLI